jgi:hypothetical protein
MSTSRKSTTRTEIPTRETDQSERFKEAARQLGCDESEKRFDEALREAANHRPKPEQAVESRYKDDPKSRGPAG